MKKEIGLSEFMELSTAIDNGDGTFGVEITLKDMTKSTLTVDNCKSEYDAKERAYLYLLNRINQGKLF